MNYLRTAFKQLRISAKTTGMFMLCLFMFYNGHAQLKSNIRFKTFSTASDSILLDSLSVVPGTVMLRTVNGPVDSSSYEVRAFESKLVWKKKPATDSVQALFRVYPFALGNTSAHKSYAKYVNATHNSAANPFVYHPEDAPFKLIDFGNLDYNGTFSRSISFGSNQDVVLNSNFNLQLSGMLTKDLEITAAVTDNNIPIQPEGNTQQIQEFDKIFIQLRKDQHRVIMGDFDLSNPQGDYFMRFAKKYQGGYYTDSFNIKNVGTLKTGVAGGISKGIFARNTLSVSDGNQGPYKLIGTNGETYIIILANSEAVYINGAKMDRGADRDYVIDYNLGEITFTPKRIITKDMRVVVEFQYSQRNYLRTAAFLNTELITKKVNVHFNLFSEQDSKEQNVQQDLNAGKKTFLTGLGDSTQNAFYQGWDSVAFDPNRILYRKIDTVDNATTYSPVFVYSTDSTVAKYAVNFSYVGDYKGNYVPLTSNANGRVYQWVAPALDTATNTYKPQGSYEPVILLVAPQYQQLYTLGAAYNINKNNTVAADVAMSNVDPNMFSKIDNNTHIGFAGRVGYKGAFTTKLDSASHRKQGVEVAVDYEGVQNRFTPIERYRTVEFNRDWNIATGNTAINTTTHYNEHLASGQVGYVWNGIGRLDYRFRSFIQDSVYKGYENSLNGSFVKGGFKAVITNSYLKSTSMSGSSDFIRPSADISYAIKKIKGWRIGAGYNNEINMIKDRDSSALDSTSYLWQNYKVYFNSPDSMRNKFGIEYNMRYEHRAKGTSFNKPYYGAQSVAVTGQLNTVKNQTLNYSLTYRHATNTDSTNTNQPEHFYLGRVDYTVTALKGVFKSNTLYELGAGREQKTQVNYQVSPTNQGDYIWKDINGDGIKQLNEFVQSPYREDTSYIRVFVVTPEFVAVNSTTFNEVLNINPAAVWKNAKGAKKVIGMFSAFASVQVTKKTYAGRDKKIANYFNPIPLHSEDSDLVSTAVSSRNSLYFNRLDPKYGAQFDFNYSQDRTLLTTGFENRTMQSEGVSVRWNAFKAFNSTYSYTNGFKANESDFYAQQQYHFTYNDVGATFSYQLKTSLRLTAKYDFSLKVNPNDSVGKQTAQINQLSLEMRYNRLSKNTVTASLSYASIKYNDRNLQNEQLEYAMLEGLHNGNNLVWSVGYEQNLTGNIQLSLSYDGRMTGFTSGDKTTLKPVHTGRAEIRALF